MWSGEGVFRRACPSGQLGWAVSSPVSPWWVSRRPDQSVYPLGGISAAPQKSQPP